MKKISLISGISLIVLSAAVYFVGKFNYEFALATCFGTKEYYLEARYHFNSVIAASRLILIAGIVILVLTFIVSLIRKS